MRYIFSGSAVVDNDNSSGLGIKGNPPLIAIFNYHNIEAEKTGKTNYQTQGLAYSLENGEIGKNIITIQLLKMKFSKI